ncbi:MAG: hypothetical protein M3Y50_04020 [Acidobacteriota bacterium]|nr:hypothetical protein [Acidobacteriota bacterium]
MLVVVVKRRVTCSPVPAHPVPEQHQDMRFFHGFLDRRDRQQCSASQIVDKQSSTVLKIPPVSVSEAFAAASPEVAVKLV